MGAFTRSRCARPALAAAALVWLLGCAALAQEPAGHHHRFTDAAQWAKVFDDPERDRWQRPDEVVAALRLAPDARVADIGAGTGYFTVRIARAVPRGHVYAVDIEADMVRYVTERAQREQLPNVTAVLAAPDDPKLPMAVDRVLVVDTYHHIEGREAYFRRVKSRLKPDGEVAIVDFTKESPIGPPAAMRLAPDTVKQEMARAGYVLAVEHPLPNQYVLVFRPRAP